MPKNRKVPRILHTLRTMKQPGSHYAGRTPGIHNYTHPAQSMPSGIIIPDPGWMTPVFPESVVQMSSFYV